MPPSSLQRVSGKGLQSSLGAVDVLRDAQLEPLDSLVDGAVRGGTRRSNIASVASSLPPPIRVAAGDLRALMAGSGGGELRTTGVDYSIVLQFHRRYERVGLRLSRRLAVPLVLRVEALETREERPGSEAARFPALG